VSELPKGWIETKISDVTEYVQRGKGPKYTDVKSFPVVNQKAIRWFGIQEEHLKYVREEMWDKYTEERFIRSGDILWNSTGTGTIGRACLLDDKEAVKAKVVDSHVTIVRSNKSIDPRYLFNWIKSPKIQFDIESLSTGTTNQVELSKAKVLDTIIPLAPLNEQIRIADKLDSILAKVDAAQARLDKIPNMLKRFRQSVLAAATSGELTKEWRDNNGTCFQDDWSERSIKDITLKSFDGPFGSKLKTADYTLSGVKVARLENIGQLNFISHKETFVSEEKFTELKKHKLEHNDVLFSSFVDEDIRVCLFDIKYGTYINKADCFCLRPDKKEVLPAFLSYFLASRKTYEEARKQVHGATRPRINLTFLKSLTLYIPSLLEQREAVRKIETLFSMADVVERQYTETKARTNRLTQSILAKAFRGELVPQDKNDEPACELLARIKTNSDSAIIKPKVKRKTKKS